MTTRAVRDGDDYVLTGAKAWTTHGGHADFYKVMARTAGEPGDRDGITCFLVPAERRRAHRRPARAEDGADRQRHRDHALRRRPGAGLPAARRGGRGAQDRPGGPGRRPARHRRGRHRPGPGRPRPRRRLRQGAQHLRPQDHRPPRARVRARRHGGRGRVGPGDLPRRRPPQGPGAALLHPGVRGQAGRDRQRDEGDHRRGPGARRLRLHPRLPRRALHARGEGHADLRGHQPDPAPGHQPRTRRQATGGSVTVAP